MPVFDTKKSIFIILLLVIMLLPTFTLLPESLSELAGTAGFELMDKSGLTLALSPVDAAVRELSAEPSNKLVLKAVVRDSDGNAVKDAKIFAEVSGGLGTIAPADAVSDSDGSVLLQYSPPFLGAEAFRSSSPSVKITAGIYGTESRSAYALSLTRIPVVFIHGYKASPEIFSSMREYLEGKGFVTEGFSYDSDKGVASGAAGLDKFIGKLKADFIGKSVQVGKVDIIAHSMGGLVARYYSCSTGYPAKSDVDKIIFISVPQMGSPIAALGLQYYSDEGIHDLIPDSRLFTSEFPSMINGGLNSSIQVGSILGQYDEVVGPESASLERWGIRTEMFDVGDSNFTVDKLLSGKLVEAANHKVVLYNKTVFRRVEEMLGSILPYPARK